MLRFFLIIVLLWVASTEAEAQTADDSGLRISASVDTIGEWGFGETGQDSRRIFPREVELALFGPVDHVFEGMLSTAAHQESGQTVLELHEGYISSSKAVARSRFKFGQYFLGIGRLNRFHRHDWPFLSTPLVQEEFLDEEGVLDSGLEWSWLTPLPFYLDLTFGVTSGYTFGHTHSAGFKPKVPTVYFRPATFFELGKNSGAELGLTSLYRKDNTDSSLTLLGMDFTLKTREGKMLHFLLQSEFWYRNSVSASDTKELGFYLYPQWGLSTQWSLGARLDGLKTLGNGGYQMALVPTLTFNNSEFSRFRLEYNHQIENDGANSTLTPVLRLQATFFLGAHPAHDF